MPILIHANKTPTSTLVLFQRWLVAFVGILLSLVLVACTSTPTEQPPTADTNQNTAERVVSLTSLSSDIIYQLDQTKLVGITGSRLLNQDPRFEEIPKVSQGQTLPNLEKIVALKPDLVIANAEFHAQLLPKFKELGITTLTTKIEKWQDLETITNTLAEAIGADPTSLLSRYQTFLGEPVADSPSTLVLVSRQPILAPNKDSWAGDLLTKFGAENLVADLQGKSPVGGYVTLSAEKVLEANPEVLLVVDTGQGIVEQFKSEPFWNQLKATKGDRVYVFDYYGLVNPGSIDKIEAACNQLKKALSGT